MRRIGAAVIQLPIAERLWKLHLQRRLEQSHTGLRALHRGEPDTQEQLPFQFRENGMSTLVLAFAAGTFSGAEVDFDPSRLSIELWVALRQVPVDGGMPVDDRSGNTRS